MNPLALIVRLWRKRLRGIDKRVLWPICKREAMMRHGEDWRFYAHAAFALHARLDPAWRDLSADEAIAEIEALR